MSDHSTVNRDQFLRALRAYCRRNDLDAPRFDAGHGKGGHGRIWLGARFTTAKTGEISRPLHKAMLVQLGLPADAF